MPHFAPSPGAPLGIYIQIPFCASKCTFCNFSSQVERSTIFDAYAHALQNEVERWPRDLRSFGVNPDLFTQEVDSIYMGGGTPTLLGPDRLSAIVGTLRERLNCADEIEFTLETTPGSADVAVLKEFVRLGINRLSIGAQTFIEQELRSTGRLHSVDDAVLTVRDAREAGFRNLSLDLIAGLPHQTKESFRKSLQSLAWLRPEHVSLYLFEVDEKSRLGNEVVHGGGRYSAPNVPSDDFMAEAYEMGCDFLSREGYVQYEISNFALSGFESRHNRKYWQLAPYVGLGAGAHSFNGARRWSNEIDVRSYLEKVEAGKSPVAEVRALSAEEKIEEFFFLGLREAEGVDLNAARECWGPAALEPWEERSAHLVRDGWLVHEGGRIYLARRAYLVSNEIFQEFVSA